MEITRAVISEQGAVDLETAEIPDSPGPEEVLVETEASFISAGTELSGYAGLNPGRPEPGPPTYPVYPGYLNAGRILDVGEGVAGFAPGDRVMSWGGHASRHFQTPEGSRLVVHVPDGVGIDEAAASWLAGIAMTGLQAGSTGLNDWVAVFGLGMVGCLAAQLFKLSGARVVGVDPVLARREAAGRVGIEWVVGGDPEAVAARLREICGAEGPRITVDAVGHSSVVEQAAAVTAPHGGVILVGTQRADYQTDLTAVLRNVHWRWVTIIGAQVWRIPLRPIQGVRNSNYGNALTVMNLIESGRLKLTELISHRLPASRIRDAYEGLTNDKENYLGVSLRWKGQE